MSNGEKRKGIREITRDLIIERCLIHGLPHIVDSKKSLWIRISWGFLLLISLGLYFYFLFLISFKFFINPDITVNYGNRPMRELPFPAITICTPNVIGTSDTYLLSTTIYQWCDPEYALYNMYYVKQGHRVDVMKEMNELQLDFNQSLFDCSYKKNPVDCSKLFTRVLTDFGYCFTYNMQDHHAIFNEEISKDFDGYKKEEEEKIQWTLDGGYNTNSKDVKPIRATKFEELTFFFKAPLNSYLITCSSDIFLSFVFFLHLPNEITTVSRQNVIKIWKSYELTIHAKSYGLINQVKSSPIEVRKCYLEGEKKLKFFKQYTENMCRLECLTNFTLNSCKCVKFSMPRDDETRVCSNYEEIRCMIEAISIWNKLKYNCSCLRTCNDIKYYVEYDKKSNIAEALDDQGQNFYVPENFTASRIRFKILNHEVEEDLKVCSYNSISYLIDLAGLTGLFTGCSIISLLELAFFTVERRRRQRREGTTLSESSLDDFVQSSSIEGAKCFHSSESKFVKMFWIFIFLICCSGLGFYIHDIYTKCKLTPYIRYEVKEVAIHEIPLPAVTVCSHQFLGIQTGDLEKFIKNPVNNLTVEVQSKMAAVIQACSPGRAKFLENSLELADSKLFVENLNLNYSFYFDNSQKCVFRHRAYECLLVWNYVLTDYGFCFSFNLENFTRLFNTEVISDDFKCYKKEVEKEVYRKFLLDFSNIKNVSLEDKKTLENVDWTLEKGYSKKHDDDDDVLPTRAFAKEYNCLNIIGGTNRFSYLCSTLGEATSIFLHMPNEILTPFHKPYHFDIGSYLYLDAKIYKTDKNLKPYPPIERGCYFDGEKSLKFFKSYTKAHCEFECLTNFTLDVCGCVKFSMPRENSTKICGINQTSCYVETMRNWSSNDDSKCDCLHSCTYIEYSKESTYKWKNEYSTWCFEFQRGFIKSLKKVSSYDLENGLADFGGLLGVFFGASMISLIEILYFCFILFIKKFNIQVENSGSSENLDDSENSFGANKNPGINKDSGFSEITNESTFHGFQFIFKSSLHKLFRLFWTVTFFFTFIFCLYNSRASFLKLSSNPETDLKQNQKQLEDFPFPAITICGLILSKSGLTKWLNEIYETLTNPAARSKFNEEEFKYLVANLEWFIDGYARDYTFNYNKNILNVSDPVNHRFIFDKFLYVNRSQLETDELFLECEIAGMPVVCKKVFRRILTFKGMCYSFNMQSFDSIFNEEISKNFDSYGRYEKKQDFQWSLDQGFKHQITKSLLRASVKDDLSIYLKVNVSHIHGGYNYKTFIHSPQEMLIYSSTKHYVLDFETRNIMYLKITSTKANENLRKFKPENRGCFFENERKLQFFKTYTKSNCEFECFANFTLQTCGCVSFIQIYNDSTKICNSPNEIACFGDSFRRFHPENIAMTSNCNCAPNCNRIDFDFQRIQDDEGSNQKFENFKKEIPKITHFRFRFEDSQLFEDEIFVTYNFLNFITDFGGLLGLFLGCSILSLFELIYYPTKFIIDKVKMKRNEVNVEEYEDSGLYRSQSNIKSQEESGADSKTNPENKNKVLNVNKNKRTSSMNEIQENDSEVLHGTDQHNLQIDPEIELEHQNFVELLCEFEKTFSH